MTDRSVPGTPLPVIPGVTLEQFDAMMDRVRVTQQRQQFTGIQEEHLQQQRGMQQLQTNTQQLQSTMQQLQSTMQQLQIGFAIARSGFTVELCVLFLLSV